VRRAEFFRKGRKMRDVIKGKKWLLLSRWKNLGVLNRFGEAQSDMRESWPRLRNSI
jgi:hypothetical protein